MTESGQLQPEDTLEDRGVDDVLDEGISPPERLRGATAKGVTEAEQAEGETFEERLAQEEPDPSAVPAEDIVDAEEVEDPSDRYAGDERSGRLLAPDEGVDHDHVQQQLATDVGIDGGAASAEEAAVHVQDEGVEDGAPDPD